MTGIVDLDSHLSDADPEMWRPYLPAAASDLVPTLVDTPSGRRLQVAGRLFPKAEPPGIGSPLGVRATTLFPTLDERREYMSKHGIALAVLLPGFVGLGAVTSPDERARRTLTTAHNRLVADVATESGGTIEFAPVISVDDAEWSLRHLRELRAERDVRAVVSRPTTLVARPYRDAASNALLRYLVDEGIGLVLHGATGYHQVSPLADLHDDYRLAHVFSHPFEQMLALADLLDSGLLSHGLRLAVAEGGCGWVPWFLARLQAHYDETGGVTARTVDVTEVIRATTVFAVESGDPGIGAVLETLGPGVLALATDYPHWDAAAPDLTHLARWGDGAVEQIAHGAALRFLGADREVRP